MSDLLVAGVSFVAGGLTTAWALLVLSIANSRHHDTQRDRQR